MISPIEKATKLIALAVDPNVGADEGRNAAMAAVRLIHSHGLLQDRDKTFDELFPGTPFEPPPPPEREYKPRKPRKPRKPKDQTTEAQPEPEAVKSPRAKKKMPKEKVLSRADIKNAADARVSKLVSFLVRKSITKDYPCVSVRKLTEMAVTEGLVGTLDQAIFYHYAHKALAKKVQSGILARKNGQKGGYYLA